MKSKAKPGFRLSREKIKSPQGLAKLLRKSGKTVIMTNGCFDLLHKGHVSYLERARKLGDRLVVALNTDASVKRLKGPERPLNRLEDRLEVLAALECVDYVTWFDEDTPLKLILALHPDVLVKGGDYTVGSTVGAKEVLGWGGKVKMISFVKGQSTTRLIERVRRPS